MVWDEVEVEVGVGVKVEVEVEVGISDRKTLGHQPGTCSKNPRHMPGLAGYCRYATIYSVRKTLGQPSKNSQATSLGGGQ